MTIYIAPGYLIIGGIIFMMVSFILISKFLTSDYFYNLTGRKIFYVKDTNPNETIDSINEIRVGRRHDSLNYMKHTGRRELIDSVSLPFTSVYACLLILFITGIIYLLAGNYPMLYAGYFGCGLVVYFTFLICLRIKIFYYGGSKAECEKRCPGSYPRVSYVWTILLSFYTTILFFLYIVTYKQSFIYGIIVLLIVAHLYIFPDYMNKVLPYDLRSLKGNFVESFIIVIPILYIVYIIVFS
ncbi:hypothetical protein [uncultured Methanosphaera sp.]|uniref:hypothetical protein n=1 Tax=uncultured Methanosphaera sp. TaxID=262501 RepID=UPI002805478C|nr:hypothetical protein [uncultured Methanosphaera sp.]